MMSHITGCSPCAGELQRLEHVLGLMRTDNAEDAPRDAIAYTKSMFRQLNPAEHQSLLRRVIAALTFDSLSVAPAFGLRSGQAPSRQLLYSAGDADLDLRISPQENNWLVAGQILGRGCAGGAVTLEGAAGSISTRLNDECEFSLPLVPPGRYKLFLRLEDIEVEVPQLELNT